MNREWCEWCELGELCVCGSFSTEAFGQKMGNFGTWGWGFVVLYGEPGADCDSVLFICFVAAVYEHGLFNGIPG